MKFGYARSVNKEAIEVAESRLKECGCDEVFADMGSDVFLGELLAKVGSGDEIVLTGLAMLAPDVDGVVATVARVAQSGAALVSIDDGIDTLLDTSFFAHMQALSAVQAASKSQAVKRGMFTAKAEGRKAGRPKADDAALREALVMRESGEFTVKEILDATGVSKATFYRHAKTQGKAPDT